MNLKSQAGHLANLDDQCIIADDQDLPCQGSVKAWSEWVGKRSDLLRTNHNENIFKAGYNAAMAQLTVEKPELSTAWKHDCAALCANDVELWVDRCPHCGKPRPRPPR